MYSPLQRCGGERTNGPSGATVPTREGICKWVGRLYCGNKVEILRQGLGMTQCGEIFRANTVRPYDFTTTVGEGRVLKGNLGWFPLKSRRDKITTAPKKNRCCPILATCLSVQIKFALRICNRKRHGCETRTSNEMSALLWRSNQNRRVSFNQSSKFACEFEMEKDTSAKKGGMTE